MTAKMWFVLKVSVSTEVFVLPYTIDPSASVLLDLLELVAKSMLMNVPLHLVQMEEPVLIYPKDTDAIALRDLVDCNAKKRNLIVMTTLALIAQCAEMSLVLAITHACANLVTLEIIAM